MSEGADLFGARSPPPACRTVLELAKDRGATHVEAWVTEVHERFSF